MMGALEEVPKKAFRSLLLLLNWEVWKARNAATQGFEPGLTSATM
jgi:hypothetical protein